MKKITLNSTVLIFSLGTFLLVGCEKDDEITLSPEQILTSGEWRLTNYIMDGVEYDILF